MAPIGIPEVATRAALRFDPPLLPHWLPCVIRTARTPQQHDRRAAMYYIVEITPQGIETFLEGFEEVGEAWDVLSRLQCEARRMRRKVRY